MNTKSRHTVEQDKMRFLSGISISGSAILAMTLLAVGLLIPRARAAKTVITSDQDLIMAVAQYIIDGKGVCESYFPACRPYDTTQRFVSTFL